jgi:16S rRNA (guanine527-N7)-methyltransferase
MGADSFEAVLAAAAYAGVALDTKQTGQLDSYHTWLRDEAVHAGGIGPNEEERIWTRHIADSLVFGRGFAGAVNCLDIGTGVGLPGIPLAIAYPNTDFVLLDRSTRRTDLAHRACRILEVENCRVANRDVDRVEDRYDRIVSRAAMPAAELMIHVKRLLEPGGIAHIGWSKTERPLPTPPEEWPGLRISVMQIPSQVLDTDTTLLRIEAT